MVLVRLFVCVCGGLPLGPFGFDSPNIAQRHALHVERTAEKAFMLSDRVQLSKTIERQQVARLPLFRQSRDKMLQALLKETRGYGPFSERQQVTSPYQRDKRLRALLREMKGYEPF